MSSSSEKSRDAFARLSSYRSIEDLVENIRTKTLVDEKSDRLPVEHHVTEQGTIDRRKFVAEQTDKNTPFLSGTKSLEDHSALHGNIENYIGMSTIPTGVIGPVRVIGSSAHGDFFVPLATSEGALVASYHRGAKACYLAGGATSVCLVEGVQRSPLFKFENLSYLGMFLNWTLQQVGKFIEITAASSDHAVLNDMKANIEGNHLILTFEFYTGDASGQNMVTICTNAICQYIVENAPVKPVYWFIEGNYSGDKKATALSFTSVRGKKVTSEILLPGKIVTDVLKTTPQSMDDYWRSSTIGIIQSGAIGAQGHYANGLAALLLATGQDVACVAEAAMGITRMEITADGSLYASVTLPNLIVGTVGGGTALPTQRECLEMMDCFGPGKARKLAEIAGAVVLAGELSIAAALAAGHFSSAHQKLGRKSPVTKG
jgi:hydroxymethylglutaryl-CoA reductase (NADPH)